MPWERHVPNRPATDAQLARVEAALGEKLPAAYRAFLQRADGWPWFWQSADRFGTTELLGAGRMVVARELLGYLEENGVLAEPWRWEGEADALRGVHLRPDDILPIACKDGDLDLFVIGRQHSPLPGQVIWFAAVPIEHFPTFTAYFDAMLAYNHGDIAEFRRTRPHGED